MAQRSRLFRPSTCGICSAVYPNQAKLHQHKERAHRYQLGCPLLCGFHVEDSHAYDLLEHTRNHQGWDETTRREWYWRLLKELGLTQGSQPELPTRTGHPRHRDDHLGDKLQVCFAELGLLLAQTEYKNLTGSTYEPVHSTTTDEAENHPPALPTLTIRIPGSPSSLETQPGTPEDQDNDEGSQGDTENQSNPSPGQDFRDIFGDSPGSPVERDDLMEAFSPVHVPLQSDSPHFMDTDPDTCYYPLDATIVSITPILTSIPQPSDQDLQMTTDLYVPTTEPVTPPHPSYLPPRETSKPEMTTPTPLSTLRKTDLPLPYLESDDDEVFLEVEGETYSEEQEGPIDEDALLAVSPSPLFSIFDGTSFLRMVGENNDIF